MYVLGPAVESPMCLVNEGEGPILIFGLWILFRIIAKPGRKNDKHVHIYMYMYVNMPHAEFP